MKEDQAQLIDSLNIKIELLEAEKADWEAEKERLVMELDILREEHKLVGEVRAREAQLNKEVKELLDLKESSGHAMDALTKEVEQLLEEKNEWNEEKKRITSQIQELEKETAAFNITVVKERQTYNDRIEALTREKSELSQELQEAVDSLGILQKRVSTLESTLVE
ncbi:hypothetical protein OESDEN_08192 [Oesophagostomum dentatum]|uniref:Uncharacterized protein n=1 Tax=Oesophagostomum dentatum TaxID=61180 RepID=A0A0B1T972_OESDE|nr:hypothetical protein OESDEN_08192 [Oesophagostomum dentatum]